MNVEIMSKTLLNLLATVNLNELNIYKYAERKRTSNTSLKISFNETLNKEEKESLQRKL
jgi:tRNA A37 methylthiotransferase MiaB